MHLTLTPLTTKKIEADVQFIHTANTSTLSKPVPPS